VEVQADKRAIFVVDLTTRRVTKLPGSEGLFSPRWSPDGRYIVAATAGVTALKLLDLRSGRWSMLHGRESFFPNWSRDGQYVYFGTCHGDASEPVVCRIRVPRGRPEVVAFLRGIDRTGSLGDPWVGLTPHGAPMILRDLTSEDIYELQLAR
jgi:Tol biopolymer transport system component